MSLTRQFSWFALAALVACTADPDKKAIEYTVSEVRNRIESKQFSEAVEFVTDGYTDNFGGRKNLLAERLQRQFGRYEKITLKAELDQLHIQGTLGDAIVRVKGSGERGGQKESLFGVLLLAREIHLFFEKQEGVWKISSCQLNARRSPF